MDTVYQAKSLEMRWCLACHRNPEQFIRPVEQVTTMGYTPPEPQLALGKELVEKYHVRSLTNCTACHR
jgi:mono/diheme cytochrome c family protein